MNSKTTGILAYITWIGWIVAFFAGDKEGAKFHLNQALVLWICNIVLGAIAGIVRNFGMIGLIIALIVGICEIVLFVFWIMGLIAACKEEEKPLPIIGGIKILK